PQRRTRQPRRERRLRRARPQQGSAGKKARRRIPGVRRDHHALRGPAGGALMTDGTSERQLAELHAAFRVFTDATTQLEDRYRTLQRQARALRDELEEKKRALGASIERQRCLETQALRHSRLAAMGEMAATLAHEVRNPLGAMELCIRLLADEVADRPSACRLAAQVATGIADLNHLVTNILDYTRLPEPRLVESELDAVVDEAVATALGAGGPAVERGRAPGG